MDHLTGKSSDNNTRSTERVHVGVPVELKGGVGVTRDLSTSGVYFTCERGMPVGSRISLTLVLDAANADGPLRLHCTGAVVRVEEAGESVGVAVQIEEYSVAN